VNKDVTLLFGLHEGQRGALVGAGPSLDLIQDFEDRLMTYNVVIGINEAIFAVPELDYLTCFDYKAARKTFKAWTPSLKVILAEGTSNIAPAHENTYEGPRRFPGRAGSLGEALCFARELGLAELDLYGVDLCWPTKDALKFKYAQSIHDQLEGQVYGGSSIHRCNPVGDLHRDQAFERFVIELRLHKSEFKDMDIRNKSPFSMLDCFETDLS